VGKRRASACERYSPIRVSSTMISGLRILHALRLGHHRGDSAKLQRLVDESVPVKRSPQATNR
jgi:hypothetical protein